MTNLGTFSEGIILVMLAIAAAVLGTMLNIPWLMTVAAVLFTIASSYVAGGAVGRMQLMRDVRRGAVQVQNGRFYQSKNGYLQRLRGN